MDWKTLSIELEMSGHWLRAVPNGVSVLQFAVFTSKPEANNFQSAIKKTTKLPSVILCWNIRVSEQTDQKEYNILQLRWKRANKVYLYIAMVNLSRTNLDAVPGRIAFVLFQNANTFISHYGLCYGVFRSRPLIVVEVIQFNVAIISMEVLIENLIRIPSGTPNVNYADRQMKTIHNLFIQFLIKCPIWKKKLINIYHGSGECDCCRSLIRSNQLN